MSLQFNISGMSCTACAARVERAARAVAGVTKADVNLLGSTLRVEGNSVAARADVGIAMGSGTEVAVESADIVLMREDLRQMAEVFYLGRAVLRTIRQNLFWAFFYNIIGIPLAAGVFYPFFGWQLSPVFAAAAMSLSSLCVVTNALRLRALKLPYETGEQK